MRAVKDERTSSGRPAARSAFDVRAHGDRQLQVRSPRVCGQRAGSMQLIGHIHSAKLT